MYRPAQLQPRPREDVERERTERDPEEGVADCDSTRCRWWRRASRRQRLRQGRPRGLAERLPKLPHRLQARTASNHPSPLSVDEVLVDINDPLC